MFESTYFFEYALPIIIVSIISYFMGCINTSIVITKVFKCGTDIRKMGSGNAGFTNTLRTLGKKMAILTFAGDFIKGILAVLITIWILSLYPAIYKDFVIYKCVLWFVGSMCVIGHMYPCFFGFKGGKGILTAWSVSLLIDWRVFLALISVFLIVFISSRIVSMASIFAAILYPISTFLLTYFIDYKYSGEIYLYAFPTVCSFLMATLVLYKHRGNISRLLEGKESKITACKSNLRGDS